MGKYIKLHHYLYNDYKSSNTTICPLLIDIDRIRVVTCSETGSIIHALENIEAIENLLNTKQK